MALAVCRELAGLLTVLSFGPGVRARTSAADGSALATGHASYPRHFTLCARSYLADRLAIGPPLGTRMRRG